MQSPHHPPSFIIFFSIVHHNLHLRCKSRLDDFRNTFFYVSIKNIIDKRVLGEIMFYEIVYKNQVPIKEILNSR